MTLSQRLSYFSRADFFSPAMTAKIFREPRRARYGQRRTTTVLQGRQAGEQTNRV